jgi:hypothetical protein
VLTRNMNFVQNLVGGHKISLGDQNWSSFHLVVSATQSDLNHNTIEILIVIPLKSLSLINWNFYEQTYLWTYVCFALF